MRWQANHTHAAVLHELAARPPAATWSGPIAEHMLANAAMLCYAMRCDAMLCYAMLCYAARSGPAAAALVAPTSYELVAGSRFYSTPPFIEVQHSTA
jgi:hypothetical protein